MPVPTLTQRWVGNVNGASLMEYVQQTQGVDVLMLGRRRRRRANINMSNVKTTFGQRLVFAGCLGII